MNKIKDKKIWYVLHTRSKFEKVVRDALLKKNKEAFLPTIKKRSKRRDRKLFLQAPIFPGYLFVNAGVSPAEKLDVLKTVGVVRILGNRDVPYPVEPEIIDSLKIIVQANEDVLTGQCFHKGDPVRVTYGPFTGAIGLFVRYQKTGRIVVNIDAMGQSAAVEVSADEVEPLPQKTL
jgi:transcription termination/antitermination protein NusG